MWCTLSMNISFVCHTMNKCIVTIFLSEQKRSNPDIRIHLDVSSIHGPFSRPPPQRRQACMSGADTSTHSNSLNEHSLSFLIPLALTIVLSPQASVLALDCWWPWHKPLHWAPMGHRMLFLSPEPKLQGSVHLGGPHGTHASSDSAQPGWSLPIRDSILQKGLWKVVLFLVSKCVSEVNCIVEAPKKLLRSTSAN